jgi:hypothetical protein
LRSANSVVKRRFWLGFWLFRTTDEIAQTAEFFSFGTNDLTQTCLGMSRDDSGSFLPAYAELEIVKKNPFASIDQTGMGQLMKIAAEKGNKTRPGFKPIGFAFPSQRAKFWLDVVMNTELHPLLSPGFLL